MTAVLPAAITLIGGIAIFLFSRPEVSVPDVFSAVVSFSLSMIFGVVLGSYERGQAELFAASKNYDIDRLIREADVEFRIKTYRENLGLDPIVFEALPK